MKGCFLFSGFALLLSSGFEIHIALRDACPRISAHVLAPIRRHGVAIPQKEPIGITGKGLRADPPDLDDPGTLRRRRGVFAGDYRLHLHGQENQPDVHHGTGGYQSRHG